MVSVKYVVVCCDGMSDLPIPKLSGKTPLEAADTPNMDSLAQGGECGLLQTMVSGLPQDSGVANLAILGYDPVKFYPGRGPLEAANMGIVLDSSDVILRCNTVTVEYGVLVDYSGGHISSGESRKLVEYGNEKLGGGPLKIFPGVSYRHVAVLSGDFSADIACKPPHDIIGGKVEDNLIEPIDSRAGETSEKLNGIMLDSKEYLEDHPVNINRIQNGLKPANMLWFWGPGRKPSLPAFREKFGLSGSVISAVDIIKGIGASIGLEVVNVEGATGYLDTNYEGKADAAVESLKSVDFTYIHVESPDESGHERNIEHKIQAIEDIDKRVLGRLLDKLEGDYVIGVLPDHATPISLGTHTGEPVPFLIYSTLREGSRSCESFSEKNSSNGIFGVKGAEEFINLLLSAGNQ